MDGWRKGRADATPGVEFQVEPLKLRDVEFDCAEVVEGALAQVRKNAQKAGAHVQTAVVGAVPQCARGSAVHIHQIITMMASSLWDVGRAENLEVKALFETRQDGDARMVLSFLLSSSNGTDENVCARLTGLTDKAALVEAVRCGGAELGLMSAWELASALGGGPSVETAEDGKVLMKVALPLQRWEKS